MNLFEHTSIQYNQSLNSIFYPYISTSLMYCKGKVAKKDVSMELLRTNSVIITKETCKVLSIFKSQSIFYIPAKVKTAINRHIPAMDLKQINSDIDTAKEMLLIFLSYFSKTYIAFRIGDKDGEAIALSSKNLCDTFGYRIYKRIINVLIKGTKQKGAIIEIRKNYIVGERSNIYALTPHYLGKGIEFYAVKTHKGKEITYKAYWRNINIAIDNPICKNLIKVYPIIDLPTSEEIYLESQKLINNNYKTKKGKILTKQGTHKKTYWKDSKSRTFVEDNLKLFQYLTKDGLMIPIPGGYRSGGRVTDSFTLMPSWIRAMITIDGKPLYEADYSCLHPNITVMLFATENERKPIRHEDVSKYLNIERQEAKIEHLSFFNKAIWQMKKSPLYKYYQDNFPVMLSRVIDDKMKSTIKHRITSARLFAIETQMMTESIKRLNCLNIYPLYVYDALLTSGKVINKTKYIMNEVAQSFGVLTEAK